MVSAVCSNRGSQTAGPCRPLKPRAHLNKMARTHDAVQGYRNRSLKRPHATSLSSITSLLVVLQFLLTFAQGQGQGGPDEASRPPVDERVVFEIREGLPPGTEVGRLNVQAGLRYRFSEDPRVFHLHPETGRITTTKVIDRESLGLPDDKFDLFVQSTPSARHLIEVRINVLDVNDNSPRFGQPSIKVSFSERDQPGTQIILETATDKDVGINDVTNKYLIITDSEDIRRKFRLVLLTDTSKPLLYLENLVVLDREEKSLYQLNISAQDGGNPPRFGYLLVNISVTDINDNPPLFDQSDYSASVKETAGPGSSIVQVRATDQDAGANGQVTYRLINDDYDQFAVDAQTGVITTAKKLYCQQSCSAAEAVARAPGCLQRSCVVTVEARDGGQPPQLGRAYVTVNIIDENDHDPVIRFSYTGKNQRNYATVNEGAKEDSVVATVSVTDSDEGLNGETSVRLVNGNERGHFRLDTRVNGFSFISVAGRLDRERVSRYNLSVEARDKGEPQRSSTAHLVIVVNDVNDHRPIFKQPSYSTEMSELAPIGSFVASITATDNDTGLNAQITYTIVSGDDPGWFHINNRTGLVTTRTLLDRERSSFLFLRILAEDGGSSPFRSYANLTVSIWDENDETPTFSSSEFRRTVSETDPAGLDIVTLVAKDDDLGRNGSVSYAFHLEVERLYPGVFTLDSRTGRISTVRQLDRETHSHYRFRVIASDNGLSPLSSTATVYVNVTDVNDNAPVFYPVRYYASVLENEPPHTEVIQVRATDQDAGKNALIYYRLIYQQSEERHFSIDITTGRISTTVQLDRERKSVYQLRVGAQDLGTPPRESDGYALVEVTVNDVHDSAPDFSAPAGGYSFTIEEDDGSARPALGRLVGIVQATSRDVGATVSYAISAGDERGVFTINSENGRISVVRAVDREEAPFYQLTVIASGGVLHGETTVNITVTDLNDNVPSFGRSSARAYVVENWPVGHEVYLADAVDPDSGNNGKITYTLSSTSRVSNRLFEINPTTGMIYLADTLSTVTEASFQVTVTATDAGIPSSSSRLGVNIVVRDVNDHTPVFDQTSYELTVSEAELVNEHIYRVVAVDKDLGLNGELTYRVVSGNSEGKFGIFPDGVLYVAKPLDREKQDLYILTVVVEDKGVEPRSSSVNVSIHIRDANDNHPVFSNYTYEMEIRENSPIGAYVGAVTATDADIGLNAEVSFHIEGEQPNFLIDPKTGAITTTAIFDREELVKEGGSDKLSIVVIASDGGERRLEEQAVVSVKVTDANDNPPTFIQDLYEPSLYESAEVNTMVVRVSADDADVGINGKVTFSIIDGNKQGAFAINANTGQVSLVGDLDRETVPEYTLVVLASDGGNPSLNATAIVRISISDNNDNPPVFSKAVVTYDVIETTQVGTQIAQVSAADADYGKNARVSYQISAGNVDTTFHVDANTGRLYLASSLDYEVRRQYNLTVTAADAGTPSLSAQTMLTVNVLDSNDNAPSFDSAPVVRQIEEGVQVGTSITVMRASDPDSGINGELRYAIIKEEPAGQHFRIDPRTGLITTAADIDREEAPMYKLTVVATDQALPARTRRWAEKKVTVLVKDLNDNAPHFVSMNAVAILQGTRAGSRIATVLAIDVDEAEAGEVQYSISGGSDANSGAALFQIDADNGNLYVKRDVGSDSRAWTLTVRAQDRGVNDALGRKESSFELTVFTKASTDNGPTFSASSYAGQVYENEPAGTSILTVSASYPRGSGGAGAQGARIEYYITGITSSNIDQSRYLQVNPNTGVISTTEVLDREKGFEEFVVTVYAVDRRSTSPMTRATEVRVTLLDQNDTPPVFIPPQSEATVSEDDIPGHEVITVVAKDFDREGSLLYQIVGGNDDDTFSVDAAQGTLTLIKRVDREKRAEYVIIIEASDSVQSSRTRVSVRVIDVNDEAPSFERMAYSFDVPEDTLVGTTVGRVSALDADLGKNGEVTYSLVNAWGREQFNLSPTSGVITLVGALDYEQVHHYILLVRASDGGRPALSSTVSVYVNVMDVNDNTPVFDPSSYSDEVDEAAPIGTSVLAVTATDVDDGLNGQMSYSLVGGDNAGQFSIDADTGVIRTAKPLDRETQAHYTLAVTATDLAKPPSPRLSTTTMVSVILTDANDNAPEFVPMGPITVMENAATGSPVAKISADDRDEGRNRYVEYRLTRPTDGLFSLGPVDGVLRVNQRLDRERREFYDIEVTVTDRGEPPRSTSTTMKVIVGDDNDNAPVFAPREYAQQLPEDTKVGTSLLTLSATDRDIGLNGDIRYVIVEGDPSEDFRVDSHTGELYTMKRLDYERKQSYSLRVRAEDQGATPRSDVATVTITIDDVNDNAPAFIDLPYVAYVQENLQRHPVHVLRITARDPDTGWGGRVAYSIMNGDRAFFRINATTGEIEALRGFDREAREQYELTIRAVDSGAPRRSSTALVTVLVQDVNDQTPRFQHSRYAARVEEGQVAPQFVLRVSATDQDAGSNAQIIYTIDDTFEGRFGITPNDGQIYAYRMLNREDRDTYELVVKATDSGMLPRSSSATVHVTVEDKNNNSPKFTQTLYRAFIRDPTSASMFVMGVTAVDPDLGNNGHIVYSLMEGSDRSNFIIDSETGIITAARRLASTGRTSRTYRLEVRATDKGQNPLSVDARVEVTLLPVTLTGFPTISVPQRSFRLSEMVEVGHVVTTVSGSSPRTGASLGFRIAGGNIDQSFGVSPQGEVRINRKLDYERTRSYNLWIEVFDTSGTSSGSSTTTSSSLSDFLSLDVTVEDFNDNPPVFDKTFYEVTVTEEELPPNSVIRVTATDADAGENGRLTYAIVGGNEQEAFAIDHSLGQIRTNRKLDREERDKYSLEVRAVDHGSPSFSAETIVDITVADVNDKPPVFTQHFQDTRIAENIPIGTSILKITSSDGDVGSNSVHSYSFTSSNPANPFSIERRTGVVRVAGSLDYEASKTYILQVSTNDGAHNADTPVTIRVTDVNDNPPRFTRTEYQFRYVEGQPTNIPVGTVSAGDRDSAGPNSDVYYMFKKPTRDFHIDSETGKLFPRRPLTYRTAVSGSSKASPENVRRLVVVGADRGEPPLSSETTVIVVIEASNKMAPKFDRDTYDEAVPENAPLGYVVTRLNATDEIEEGVYGEVEYLPTSGNGTSIFNVNINTGIVSVDASVSGHRGRKYVITVTARDKGDPPRSATVDVRIQVAEVNRNAPRFVGFDAAFRSTVPENNELQSIIGQVRATDADNGANGLVSYFLSGGDPEGQFSVDESQGYIRLIKPLDFEKIRNYRLNVTARDRGAIPRATSRIFTVSVTDVDDNAPEFPPEMIGFIQENSPSGTEVFTATATDADTGDNAIIEYRIDGGQDALDKFTIDDATGIIRSQGSIDYEVQTEYSVAVRGTNPRSGLSGTATVRVEVIGVNEYTPQFEQTEYQFVVSESARPGDIVGSVRARDQDGGQEGIVYYYLVGDSNLRGFAVDRISGDVSIASPVDRESTSEVSLVLLAKNRGPIRGNDTATCRVRVLVRDANDPPIFSSRVYRVSVPEDAQRGQLVVQVMASDSDLQSSFRSFTYRLQPPTSTGNPNVASLPFAVDSTTGRLTVNGPLDRETQPLYNLTVLATDSGSPPMTGSATVEVTLDDVNDNGPHFVPEIPVGYVTENAPPLTEVVLSLSSYTFDADTKPFQGPYKYRLLEDSDKFEVGVTSALVKARVRLDRELNDEYLLRFVVADRGTPVMSSTLTAKVLVRDQNDNPSDSRPLQVVVMGFNGSYAGGVVADVRPLDADTTGDWWCRITQGDQSVLRMESACRLRATSVRTGRQFNLNITGSDGVHDAVPYQATVRFLDFDSRAVEDGLAIRVGVNKAEYFLASFYRKFLVATEEALAAQDASPLLFSMGNMGGFTVFHLAAQKADGSYLTRAALGGVIQANRKAIQDSVGLELENFDYDPCDDDPCMNDADCSSGKKVGAYSTIDSAAIIFTAPVIEMDVQCKCREGFTGERCESPLNKCDDALCQHGGTCFSPPTSAGASARCLCPPGWSGAICEVDINECQAMRPCRNGGTCTNQVGSYKCACPAQFAGQNCEYRNDFCASSPCRNSASCVAKDAGFECLCAFGQRGARCEVASKGFGPLSYMEYTLDWDPRRNAITMEFATAEERALLFYGSGSSTSGMGEFLAVEIVDGLVRFSFALGEGSVTRLTVGRRVNDGRWYRVHADRTDKVGTLRVTECVDGEDSCRSCDDGDPSCYKRKEHSGAGRELRLTNNRVTVGGVRTINTVLTNPGQVSSHDFVGCLRAFSVNGRDLMSMAPEAEEAVEEGCPRREARLCRPGLCQRGGVCVDEWSSYSCRCPPGSAGKDCSEDSVPFSFGPDAMVVYRQRESYKRDQQFASSPSAQRRRRRRQAEVGGRSVSLTFRTGQQEGLLFYSATGADHTTIQVYNDQVLYRSVVRGQVFSLPAPQDVKVTNSQWHNVTINVRGSAVTMTLDDAETGDKFSSPVHNPLELDIDKMSIGGTDDPVTVSGASPIKGFEGCISEFRLDGRVLPFSGSTDRFVAVPIGGANNVTCAAGILGSPAGTSVHVAVIVVVVFFAIVLIVIVATFLVIRLRRRRKEAAAAGGLGTGGKAGKMNGSVGKTNGAILNKTGSGSASDSRSHQDSGFTENGDLSEEAIIQQHVQRELASRSFNEREVREQQFASSRPDLVSPEMGGGGSGDGIGMDNNGYSEEPPEHYDIDNASSIAPSDLVDVTGHYKRYRQSGGVGGGKHHHQYNVPPPGQMNRGRHTPSPANVLGGGGVPGGKPYGVRESPLTVGHRQSPAVQMMAQHHRDSPNMHASTPLNRGMSPLPVVPGSRQHTPNHMLGPQHPPPISPVGLNNLSRTSPALIERTTSPFSQNQLGRGQSPSVLHMRDKRMSPLPAGVNSMRSTPVNGLYPSNASNGSGTGAGAVGYGGDRNHKAANGHPPHLPAPRPNSRMKQPINQMAMSRATPTRGLTVEDVERLNARSKPSPASTLDVGSSSSDDAPRQNLLQQQQGRARTPLAMSPFDPGRALQMEPPPDSSSDDGSNDSFTCSEFEYDNDKAPGVGGKGEYIPNRSAFPKLTEVSENDDTDASRTFTPNGSDSNRDGSLSTFFSDDDLPSKSGSKLLNGALNWDYLLNWGPNFEKLVGVFTDIAELPDGSSLLEKKGKKSAPATSGSAKPSSPAVESPPQMQPHDDSGAAADIVDVDFVASEATNSQVREEYV